MLSIALNVNQSNGVYIGIPLNSNINNSILNIKLYGKVL